MGLVRIAWCFLSPRGRLTRQEFLLAYVLLVIVDSLAIHLALTPTADGSAYEVNDAHGSALGLFLLATTWPSCAIQWKRLQDTGWPGFLVLPAGFIAVSLMVVNVWAGLLALLAIVVYLAAVKGEAGDNRYGPNPLAS